MNQEQVFLLLAIIFILFLLSTMFVHSKRWKKEEQITSSLLLFGNPILKHIEIVNNTTIVWKTWRIIDCIGNTYLPKSTTPIYTGQSACILSMPANSSKLLIASDNAGNYILENITVTANQFALSSVLIKGTTSIHPLTMDQTVCINEQQSLGVIPFLPTTIEKLTVLTPTMYETNNSVTLFTSPSFSYATALPVETHFIPGNITLESWLSTPSTATKFPPNIVIQNAYPGSATVMMFCSYGGIKTQNEVPTLGQVTFDTSKFKDKDYLYVILMYHDVIPCSFTLNLSGCILYNMGGICNKAYLFGQPEQCVGRPPFTITISGQAHGLT